jgi:hypothetical protein
MSKFLRVLESNLPTEGQDELAHDVLMNIRTSLQELDSKFTIGTSMPENSPPDGVNVIWSAMMNINGIPRFKITVTPIEAKAPIKSEEAEDGAVVSAAAEIVGKDPAQKSLKTQIQAGAVKLSRTAIEQMEKERQRLASNSSKKI